MSLYKKAAHMNLTVRRGKRELRGEMVANEVSLPHLVHMQIDVDRIFNELAVKAAKAKSRKATAFYGAIVVEAREVKP